MTLGSKALKALGEITRLLELGDVTICEILDHLDSMTAPEAPALVGAVLTIPPDDERALARMSESSERRGFTAAEAREAMLPIYEARGEVHMRDMAHQLIRDGFGRRPLKLNEHRKIIDFCHELTSAVKGDVHMFEQVSGVQSTWRIKRLNTDEATNDES